MAVGRHLSALEAATAGGPCTLGELVQRMEHAGYGLILIFVCLPFLQPIPLGGLSSLVGPFVFVMGVQLALHRPRPWLPGWISRRTLDQRLLGILLGAARRFFGLVERFARPRWCALARAESAAGLVMALCGALLSLPFPIPLSNVACAAPIVLLALGLLEEDGVLAALGYTGAGVTVALHAGLAILGMDGARNLWRSLAG